MHRADRSLVVNLYPLNDDRAAGTSLDEASRTSTSAAAMRRRPRIHEASRSWSTPPITDGSPRRCAAAGVGGAAGAGRPRSPTPRLTRRSPRTCRRSTSGRRRAMPSRCGKPPDTLAVVARLKELRYARTPPAAAFYADARSPLPPPRRRADDRRGRGAGRQAGRTTTSWTSTPRSAWCSSSPSRPPSWSSTTTRAASRSIATSPPRGRARRRCAVGVRRSSR